MRGLVVGAALMGSLALASTAHAVTFQDGDGLHVQSVKKLDPRLVALQVKTAALPDPANIYILLPPGYDANAPQRYPVFYLLHGTSGHAPGSTTWRPTPSSATR